jgi:Fungal specific transcription factor domain/Fungal Zn(2)-Cys(6) binuclear cluster domain
MNLEQTPSPLRARQKRTQVSRACDWCRQRRIKCDSYSPCTNCKVRGGNCTRDAAEISSLPRAYREIEALRRQVEDLQGELQKQRAERGSDVSSPSINIPTPELSVSESIYSDQDEARRTVWEGIHFRTARSSNKTWYGPSSLFFFMGRITKFLSLNLEQVHSHDQMVPDSVSRRLAGPLLGPEHDPSRNHTEFQIKNTGATEAYLTPTQEEYFLDLYWNAYHTSLFPILDENEFKQHYRSLWTASGNSRNDSALVDIVVALGMQYGMSMLPTMRQQLVVDDNDATIAGRWYYRRSQTLLAYELESPTLATLQCHLLCTIYLCSGSFQNMADSTCAMAVRAAHMLGLHLDPPQNMPQRDREMRKRVWWALCSLDSKIGMKLGRPFLLHQSNTTPSLPGDEVEVAMLSGSSYAPLGDNATWLSFNLQNTKLFLGARAAHTAFFGRDLPLQNGQTVWDDFKVLEDQAQFLQPFVQRLEQWTDGVPSALTTKRKDGGRPFATDGTALEIEQFAPLWLQRQRIILELMYHNLSANIHRPFISFTPAPSSTLAEEMAFKCARHAIALTNITHHTLSSTTILSGWHEAFQWQWNSAMTLVGFVLAYPQSPLTPTARSAIALSVSVFDIFGNSFAVASSAANIVRNLITKIDFLAKRAWQNQYLSDAKEAPNHEMVPPNIMELHTEPFMDNGSAMFPTAGDGSLDFNDLTMESMQDVLHMAFDIDQWSDLSGLWAGVGGM